MIKKLAVLAMSVVTMSANAYLVTVFKDTQIDFTKPTRILVTGAGDETIRFWNVFSDEKAIQPSPKLKNIFIR